MVSSGVLRGPLTTSARHTPFNSPGRIQSPPGQTDARRSERRRQPMLFRPGLKSTVRRHSPQGRRQDCGQTGHPVELINRFDAASRGNGPDFVLGQLFVDRGPYLSYTCFPWVLQCKNPLSSAAADSVGRNRISPNAVRHSDCCYVKRRDRWCGTSPRSIVAELCRWDTHPFAVSGPRANAVWSGGKLAPCS